MWNSTLLEWPFQKIQNYTIILKKSIYIIQWVIKHMLQLQKEDQQKGWKTWIGKYRFWFRGVQRANLALTHYKLCRNKYWIIFNTCSCIIFFKPFFCIIRVPASFRIADWIRVTARLALGTPLNQNLYERFWNSVQLTEKWLF